MALGMFLLGLWSCQLAGTVGPYNGYDVLGHLFCQVRQKVWCTDGEGSIQHAQKKDKSAARIARLICPILPDKGIRGIGSISHMGQDSTQENGCCTSHDDEKAANGFDCRKGAVQVQDDKGTDPCEKEVGHQDMPLLGDKDLMHDGVHGNGHGA